MTAAVSDPTWLSGLDKPQAYADDPSAIGGITRIDTHISHVFLTPDRVYKLRRPVRLSFLDFSSPAQRLADCLREVALNRRLAEDVYLGIAPVLFTGGAVRVGAVGEEAVVQPDVVEHCVVMRRLPDGHDLRSMIERGEATAEHVDRIAARLARFHAAHSLGRPAPFASEHWLDRTTGPARANTQTLGEVSPSLAPAGEVAEVRRLAAAFVEARRNEFDARREAGRVVDGHGDLHAEHVWFETAHCDPLMIDCLEFRDDFRQIDAASDVAFLAMDLTYRGRADLAARFLRRYSRDSGDYHLFAVIDYFMSYRALVRAKVAALVAEDASMPQRQRDNAAQSVRRHLDLGLGFLRERSPGDLVLTCGTIGSGKSTVAEALAEATGGVVISSDRLRRAAAIASMQDRYSDAARTAVYEQVLAEARPVVLSGRTAILDATYSRRAWRDAAADWAGRNARRCVLVEVAAPYDEVIERLAEREAAANDASEAGPGLYDAMLAEFEPPSEWPAQDHVRVDTAATDWCEQVIAAVVVLKR